ncbi:MAG TPA: MFS transporter [Anaerovoracaceae bacterium]|nr:MFS transporter [Anaerovoracaceae bacterium]HYE68336.1 MFS transporter [Anaerovoracaceae bacterium]
MKPKRNVWLMYVIALLQGMVFYGPIATLYRQSAGVTIFEITIIESISLALCLLLELPWGIVADRIGYKKTMLFCCVLFFVSKIVFWKALGFEAFLVERIMLSIVISGLSGVDSSILYLSCDKDNTQRVFGIYNNLQTAGMLFASAIYSLVIKDNYRLAGFLTVFSYGIATIIAFWLVELKNNNNGKSREGAGNFFVLLKRILKYKYLILFLVGVALLNETHQTITVFLNQLQYVKCGLSDAAIGYIYIGVTLVGLLGIFSEKLTRKLGKMQFVSILYGSAVIACIILGVTVNAWLSVASIVILRISFSLFQPLQMELQNKQVVSQNRATELSINAVIINCVGIGTNLIYGKLAYVNIAFAMFTGALLCLAGFLLIYLWQTKCRGNLQS